VKTHCGRSTRNSGWALRGLERAVTWLLGGGHHGYCRQRAIRLVMLSAPKRIRTTHQARRPMLYPGMVGSVVPWERVPVNGLSLDKQTQSTPSPARRRYLTGVTHGLGRFVSSTDRRGVIRRLIAVKTARLGGASTWRRRWTADCLERVCPRSIRTSSRLRRDDAAARRMGRQRFGCRKYPETAPNQGGADHRPRPRRTTEQAAGGGCRR